MMEDSSPPPPPPPSSPPPPRPTEDRNTLGFRQSEENVTPPINPFSEILQKPVIVEDSTSESQQLVVSPGADKRGLSSFVTVDGDNDGANTGLVEVDFSKVAPTETVKKGLLWKRSRSRKFFSKVLGIKNWKERMFVMTGSRELWVSIKISFLPFYGHCNMILLLHIDFITIHHTFPSYLFMQYYVPGSEGNTLNAKGKLLLNECSVKRVEDALAFGRINAFEITTADGETLLLSGSSESDSEMWINAIQNAGS